MRILLVEDDHSLCEAIQYHLEREQYVVDLCHAGDDAVAWLEQQAHSLVILDRMLPGMDGVEVLQKIRQAGNGVPVLMVTALDGIGDRVSGLDAGADDYLVKPFAVEELLARVRSLGRRPVEWRGTKVLEFGDLSLDPERHRLTCRGRSVLLSKREAQLFDVLLQNPRMVLTRELLFARVWGPDAPVEEGNLDNYIHFLRKRLTGLGSKVRIRTTRSVGYTLQTQENS